MPKYFFHQIHKDERIEDFEGTELADLDDARAEASAGALEIMANRLWQGKEPNHSKFEICDGDGTVLMVLPFSEVLRSTWESGSSRGSKR